jgi:acetoin utilization protein AcuB
MKEHGIRHLPVLQRGELIGVISDRDIKTAVGGLMGETPHTMLMRDICRTNPYTASPDTPLEEVAAEMEKHRYGSVLIVENRQLKGIFTTMDACRALTELAAKFNSSVSGQ